MHVGKDSCHSCLASHSLPNNHWSPLTVDLRVGSFQYFDSLCWQVARNFEETTQNGY